MADFEQEWANKPFKCMITYSSNNGSGRMFICRDRAADTMEDFIGIEKTILRELKTKDKYTEQVFVTNVIHLRG